MNATICQNGQWFSLYQIRQLSEYLDLSLRKLSQCLESPSLFCQIMELTCWRPWWQTCALTTACYPQCNSMVERMNRTVLWRPRCRSTLWNLDHSGASSCQVSYTLIAVPFLRLQRRSYFFHVRPRSLITHKSSAIACQFSGDNQCQWLPRVSCKVTQHWRMGSSSIPTWRNWEEVQVVWAMA